MRDSLDALPNNSTAGAPLGKDPMGLKRSRETPEDALPPRTFTKKHTQKLKEFKTATPTREP